MEGDREKPLPPALGTRPSLSPQVLTSLPQYLKSNCFPQRSPGSKLEGNLQIFQPKPPGNSFMVSLMAQIMLILQRFTASFTSLPHDCPVCPEELCPPAGGWYIPPFFNLGPCTLLWLLKYVHQCHFWAVALRNNSWFVMTLFPLTQGKGSVSQVRAALSPGPPRKNTAEEIHDSHDGHVTWVISKPEFLQATEVLGGLCYCIKPRYRCLSHQMIMSVYLNPSSDKNYYYYSRQNISSLDSPDF